MERWWSVHGYIIASLAAWNELLCIILKASAKKLQSFPSKDHQSCFLWRDGKSLHFAFYRILYFSVTILLDLHWNVHLSRISNEIFKYRNVCWQIWNVTVRSSWLVLTCLSLHSLIPTFTASETPKNCCLHNMS